MTVDKKRKRLVRDRMARTGESYSEARRQMHYQTLLESGAEVSPDPQTPEGRALAQAIADARARYRP